MICEPCMDAADNGAYYNHENCESCDCQHAEAGDDRYIAVMNEAFERRAD